MNNLIVFQKSLQSNNADQVRQFLAELPRISTNEGLKAAGEAFGFPTVVVEEIRYMLGRDLARVGYGHTDIASLQKLLKNYDRSLLSFGRFGIDCQIIIRQGFSLNPQDQKSTLATWGDLLIVGMKGETEAARKIMAYLLEAEEKARVAQTCEMITGLSPRQLKTSESADPILQVLAQNQQNTQALIQIRQRQLEDQKTLSIHDQVLSDQGRKIKAIAATQDEELELTADQEKTLNALMNRLISARAFARKLPAGQVAPALWNWIKQRLGIRTFKSISRARYPMAVDILQTQIAREETEGSQANLKLVTLKNIKKKEPWGNQ